VERWAKLVDLRKKYLLKKEDLLVVIKIGREGEPVEKKSTIVTGPIRAHNP
jgi:hypothetical protein